MVHRIMAIRLQCVKYVGKRVTVPWNVDIGTITLIKVLIPPHSLTAYAAQAPSQMSAAEFGQHVQGFSAADTWVLDTGASHHMTSNLGNLNQPVQNNGDEKITIGNGEGLAVEHIGSAIISTSQHSLSLRNILHVPTITINLLSVKKLCKDNGLLVHL